MQQINIVSSGAKINEVTTEFKLNPTLEYIRTIGPCVQGHGSIQHTAVHINVHCMHHYMQSAYIKLKETLLNSVI